MADEKYLNYTGLSHYDEKIKEVIQKDLAPAFSTSATYSVGALVVYKGLLYKCSSAVTTAGNWNSTNWTQIKVSDEFLRKIPAGPTGTTVGDSSHIPTFTFDNTGNISAIGVADVVSANDGKLTINGATANDKIEFTANQSGDTTGTIDKSFVGLSYVENMGYSNEYNDEAQDYDPDTYFTSEGASTLYNDLKEQIKTQAAHFRGSWSTWATVPSNASDYPADADGNKTPTANDYMVVANASDYPVASGTPVLTGTWRFIYTGVWSTNGKNGWTPAYKIDGSISYSDLSGKPTVKYGSNTATPITALEFVAGTNVTLTQDGSNSNKVTIASTDNNYYPTTFIWSSGTTSGPTGSLSGNSGFSSVSFPAIPSASTTSSGIVTTGNQSFAGTKTFIDGTLKIGPHTDESGVTATLVLDGGDAAYSGDYGRITSGLSNGPKIDFESNALTLTAGYNGDRGGGDVYIKGGPRNDNEGGRVIFAPHYYDSTEGTGGYTYFTFNATAGSSSASSPAIIATTDDITVTGVTDGIFDLSVSSKNIGVAPYSSTTATSTWVGTDANAGKFYLGTQNPGKTTRLNYNGNFHANQITAVGNVYASSVWAGSSGSVGAVNGSGYGVALTQNKTILIYNGGTSASATLTLPTTTGTLALTSDIPTVPSVSLTQSSSGSGDSAVTTTTWGLDSTSVSFVTISNSEIDTLFA